jgi:hypothetical protein
VKQDKEFEEQFTCQIAEIFGAIFKTHKKKALQIAYKLYENYIVNAIQDSMPPKIIKFGIFLIDDSIDHLGEFLDPALLEKFYQILLRFVNHTDIEVRHASTYGIGALSNCFKKDFVHHYDETVKVLCTALEVQPACKEEEMRWSITKDNIVSALGKTLKNCYEVLDPTRKYELMVFWLDRLPLLNDTIEGIIQHSFLTELILAEGNAVIGSNFENVPKIIRIFSTLVNYKRIIYNKETMNNMAVIIKGFFQNENIKQFIMGLQLSEDEKKALENLNNTPT